MWLLLEHSTLLGQVDSLMLGGKSDQLNLPVKPASETFGFSGRETSPPEHTRPGHFLKTLRSQEKALSLASYGAPYNWRYVIIGDSAVTIHRKLGAKEEKRQRKI